jgi:probable HAF family extracellular repeat protein
MRLRSGLPALLLGAGHLTADILYRVRDWGTRGGTIREARGINNAGQVIGYSYSATGDPPAHAFLYSNGQVSDLGTLGGSFREGVRINNAGQVTGYSRLSGAAISHSFLYSNGQMADRGTLGGLSFGEAIHDAGQVVGESYYVPAGSFHAFLSSNGQRKDLNDWIDSQLAIMLFNATGINNKGQIVAGGPSQPGFHGFLLTPVPEPSTLALCGVAALAVHIMANTALTGATDDATAGSSSSLLVKEASIRFNESDLRFR